MNQPNTIQEICAALAEGGREDLARRIAYFASAEDLEEGDAPVTVESVLGFWEFFKAVDALEASCLIDLACSPDGCISAVWRYPDERRACVWFVNVDDTRVAATDAQGEFIDFDYDDAVNREKVAKKLVEAGLLKWRPEASKGKTLLPTPHCQVLPEPSHSSGWHTFGGGVPATRTGRISVHQLAGALQSGRSAYPDCWCAPNPARQGAHRSAVGFFRRIERGGSR